MTKRWIHTPDKFRPWQQKKRTYPKVINLADSSLLARFTRITRFLWPADGQRFASLRLNTAVSRCCLKRTLKKLISPHQRKAISLETSVIYAQTLVWALKFEIAPDNKTVSFFLDLSFLFSTFTNPQEINLQVLNYDIFDPAKTPYDADAALRLRPQLRLSRFFKVMGQNGEL